MSNESVEAYLARRAEEVNASLARLVPADDVPPATIHKAMRYSLLAGGKRLRPALVISAGEALGAKAEKLLPAACAVEMIHTYSLIHDDLPAMDDDDLRRGRPTCHKVFGEAVAILAGDALLTRAFEVLSSQEAAPDAERRLLLVRELSAAAGPVDALIGGQVVDLESEGKPVTAATLEYIHRAKTGALLRASVVMGGIVAGATAEQQVKLHTYGEKIGLAFQIADDVLDLTATAEQLGKTPGKDVAVGKATYPAVHGIEASRAMALKMISEACAAVQDLGKGAEILTALARFVVARVS
ncbi:MAG: polyprenyl synthetase family protein [Deltaproteobacteria bacterium]|nr:polyprenyl synthetase family protein [Deltaproteobacteria bacterium]